MYFIANGASTCIFFFDYTVQFGDNLDYSFPVMIRYSGDQPEFSNQLNFHEESNSESAYRYKENFHSYTRQNNCKQRRAGQVSMSM